MSKAFKNWFNLFMVALIIFVAYKFYMSNTLYRYKLIPGLSSMSTSVYEDQRDGCLYRKVDEKLIPLKRGGQHVCER